MGRSRSFFLDALPAACAVVLACASGRAAVEVRIDRPRCRLELPDGFVEVESDGREHPNHICTYTLGDRLEALLAGGVEAIEGVIYFMVMRLDTPAVMRPIDSVPVPEGSTAGTLRWRDFDVPMLESKRKRVDGERVSFGVIVPLKPVAVVLDLSGPVAKRDELKRTIQSILASVEGETNWPTSDKRAERAGSLFGGLLVVAAALGWVFYKARKRPLAPTGSDRGAA